MRDRVMRLGMLALLTALPFEIAQEIPKLEAVRLVAEVTQSGEIYTYSYAISSGGANTGQIWRWSLDIAHPAGGRDLSGEGLANGPGFQPEISRLNQRDATVPATIPVGVFVPPNWGSGLDSEGGVVWNSRDAPFRILPGQNLSGFGLTSRGLPGLRNFRMDPQFLLALDQDKMKGPEDAKAADKRQDEIQDQIAVFGKTIGPTAPPADFVALNFVSYIIGLKEESFALGWIDRSGIKQSLDAKLAAANRSLAAGDVGTARNILNAFRNEVEAQREKHLRPEGYALLKFNVAYLLAKI